MPNLHTLSLSFQSSHGKPSRPQLVASDLPSLPPAPRLHSFFLTLLGDQTFFPPNGFSQLSSQIDFANLKRLSILNLYVDTLLISTVMKACPLLEELYIAIQGKREVMDCPELRESQLRILHVVPSSSHQLAPEVSDLTDLARGMTRLQQIGVVNRVYEVVRKYEGDELVVELVRWSKTTTPGYFQVWRG
jgi:hypothetical protein